MRNCRKYPIEIDSRPTSFNIEKKEKKITELTRLKMPKLHKMNQKQMVTTSKRWQRGKFNRIW